VILLEQLISVLLCGISGPRRNGRNAQKICFCRAESTRIQLLNSSLQNMARFVSSGSYFWPVS
jgi:hypothetical protein